MALIHGSSAVFELDSNDLSPYINNTVVSQSADSHDVTTYGNTAHRKKGGLFDGTITIEGVYDDSAAGTNAIVPPLVGTVVDILWQPEGAGAGLPELTGDVLVVSYAETTPAADMISWTATLELDDEWSWAAQGA